jgi:hypothetical protein
LEFAENIKFMNITPLKQTLLRILTRSRKTLQDLSSERWIICPAERRHESPAIYLDHDLDKVTAVMEDTSWELEMSRIQGGETEHAATVAHRIQECELLDGSLYKGPARLPLTPEPKRLISANVNQVIAEGALAASYYGSLYFGHWLTDDLTLHLAAEPLGKPITPARRIYGHESNYLELFNIQPHYTNQVRCKNLIILDDFSQNSYKRQRYLELRSRLQNALPSANPGARIMIRRGQQGAARVLTNAAEIEKVLEGQGFIIVDPDKSTANEIASSLLGARLIVGLEGSHMTHSVYTVAQNGGVCVLQPPYRFNNVLKNYTDCLGIAYGFVVGRASEGGFTIEPNELLQVLDKIDQALPSA